MSARATRAVLLAAAVAFSAVALSAKPETWRKVVGPSFTVLTPDDDQAARETAMDFAQFLAVLHAHIPVHEELLPRLTIVLFRRERDFEAYRPLRADGTAQEVGGFFRRFDTWSVAGLPGTRLSPHAQRTFFHEGTHWFISGFDMAKPVWLEEGLAEVFSTFEIDGQEVRVGEAIPEHVDTVLSGRAMPLEKLLFLQESDLFTGDAEGEERTGMAYAESWAFVHFLLFGQSGLRPGAINDYVRFFPTMNPDEAFTKAFGFPYAVVDEKLQDYMRGGRYRILVRSRVALPPLTAEPATRVDVEQGLAKLALAAGRAEQAQQHAQAAIAAAPDTPEGYELLGRVFELTKDNAAARAAFADASARHSRDAHVYLLKAHLRQQELAEAGSVAMSLSPASAREIADGYEQAIALQPRLKPAYEALGGVMAVLDPATEADRAALEQGSRVYPTSPRIAVGLAVADYKAGQKDQALAKLRAIADAPDTPAAVRTYVRALETSWTGRDLVEQARQLAAQKQYDASLRLLDQALEQTSDFTARAALKQNRAQVVALQRMAEIHKLKRGQHWAEARRKLQEFLDSDAPPMAKADARRQLQDLDRRHLGLPPNPSAAVDATALKEKPAGEPAGEP